MITRSDDYVEYCRETAKHARDPHDLALRGRHLRKITNLIHERRHLLEIFDANPGRKWILFGDTGEKDPEVYHTLMQERPSTVDDVFIHKVTSADPQDARFTGFTVFTDWKDVLDTIRSRN